MIFYCEMLEKLRVMFFIIERGFLCGNEQGTMSEETFFNYLYKFDAKAEVVNFYKECLDNNKRGVY